MFWKQYTITELPPTLKILEIEQLHNQQYYATILDVLANSIHVLPVFEHDDGTYYLTRHKVRYIVDIKKP